MFRSLLFVAVICCGSQAIAKEHIVEEVPAAPGEQKAAEKPPKAGCTNSGCAIPMNETVRQRSLWRNGQLMHHRHSRTLRAARPRLERRYVIRRSFYRVRARIACR